MSARIESGPDLVSPEWTPRTLVAVRIDFWRADKGRPHNRLRYERPDHLASWERHSPWP